jgi:hypothetical protein
MKTKLIASIMLIAAVLFAQVGIVAAAPPAQDPTPITGTIQTIVPEKDAEGTTTVVVTFTDAEGATQTVRVSAETATSLGLLQTDPNTGLPLIDETTGLPLVDDTKVGTDVTIDPTTVIPDEPAEEEPVHPIAALLGDFFGVEGSVIDDYHQDGFGFGVIAQALWMSKNISGSEGGDPELAGCILDAKKNGTYGECFDFGDDPVPTNWGQFKKIYSQKKNNLGVIVSGKADKDETTDPAAQQEHGKDKNKDKGNGKGNGNGNKP